MKDVESIYAECCYYIEKELGQVITPDYPASKFHVQLEEMKKDYERQKREMQKSSMGRSKGIRTMG